MTRTKWVLMMVVLGILVSVTTVSIYMPRMIEWYFEPPSTIGISCSSSIAWAFHRFQVAQLISIGVGAFFGLIVGLRLSRKKTPQLPPTV